VETTFGMINQIFSPKRWGRYLFTALFLGLCLTGCGRKGMPVPPGTIRPKPIADLSYRITASGAELGWTVPIRNTDGSPIYRLEGFELYKAEFPLSLNENVCTLCPVSFDAPVVIPFEAVPEVSRKMFYEDRTLQPEKLYVYEVKTKKGFLNTSDASNRVTFAWHIQPGVPAGLELRLSKNGMELSWKAPLTWADGSALNLPVSFNVYKQTKDGAWKKLQKKLTQNSFTDKSVSSNQENTYAVSCELDYFGTSIEGELSEKKAFYVGNLTPPKAPRGLVAKFLQSDTDMIELLWQESSEPNLKGYFVYRQTGESDLVVRLNQQPLVTPRFNDTTVLPDGVYRYWVTAVDTASPANESSFSEKADVEILR